MIIPIYNVCFLYFFNFDNFTILQNDGEIEYFTVNVLDNDNGKAKNVWSLPSPNIQDKGLWRQGRVQISSDGDKEYQVRSLHCLPPLYHPNFKDIISIISLIYNVLNFADRIRCQAWKKWKRIRGSR